MGYGIPLDSSTLPKRSRLLALVQQHHITALALAHVSKVPVETVRALLWETEPVERTVAVKVVGAFNHMSGCAVTVEELRLRLIVDTSGDGQVP